jgi:hypothetical protein
VERRVATETIDRPIRIQENFLREVFGIVMITAKPECQSMHGSLVAGHQ